MVKKKIVPRGYHSAVFRRRVAFLLPFLAAAALAGCGGSDAPTAPAPAAALPSPATSRDVYRPPADGRVTPPQVEVYLGVLDRVRLDRKGRARRRRRPTRSRPNRPTWAWPARGASTRRSTSG